MELIFEKLAAGETFEEMLEAHPRLEAADIRAVIAFPARALSADVSLTDPFHGE